MAASGELFQAVVQFGSFLAALLEGSVRANPDRFASKRRGGSFAADGLEVGGGLRSQTERLGVTDDELQAHPKSLQPAIVKMATRLTDGRHFDQHAAKVIRHLRDFERSGRASFVFGRRLFDEVHCFVKALPTDRDDLASLHQLRIVGKHLRYASEIVSEVWPDIQLAELREHLQTLQERLGAIHDQQVGRQLLKTFSSKQSDRSLLRKMSDASDRDLRRFWRWWRSCPLERMLADTTAEVLTLMRRAVENQVEPRRTKKQTHR